MKKKIEDRIRKLELGKSDNTASLEMFEKIQAKRIEEGYKSEYDCLVDLGIIDEVVVQKGAVNLFPYIKQRHMLVKEKMSDPKVQVEVQQMQADFKKACKQIDS